MDGIAEGFARAWDLIKGSSAQVVSSISIPPDQVHGAGDPSALEPGKHYFAVTINEIFLAQDREWFTIYDPMVLVVCEFSYAGKKTVVPYVVGPVMLEGKIKEVPNGVSITDTKVAGVHPYAGGSFSLTVVLAKVKRESYAKRLLTFIEGIATAFPAGVALEPHLKVAGTLLEGVQSLFGMKDTVPLAGHRWEYNDGVTPWLKPGFFALINADQPTIDVEKLQVVDGRLRDGLTTDAPSYRRNDFLLYSLSRISLRSDVTELPFYRLYQAALPQAGSNDEGAWERAKAGLVTLYQEMLTSPDILWHQTETLIGEYKDKLVAAHKRAMDFKVMKVEGNPPPTGMHEPPGIDQEPDAKQRITSLNSAQQFLKLE